MELRCRDRLDAVVVEHGGRVDKHIGDALMAVWGTEVTREDDPERAVRAARYCSNSALGACSCGAMPGRR